MDRIARNTSDLSQFVQKDKPNLIGSKRSFVEKEEEREESEEVKGSQSGGKSSDEKRSQFVVDEDLETQRFLKKIKGDIMSI